MPIVEPQKVQPAAPNGADPSQPAEKRDIITLEELLAEEVPVSPGTISNWRRDGKIPFIQTPGRRVLFSRMAVRAALLRMQR